MKTEQLDPVEKVSQQPVRDTRTDTTQASSRALALLTRYGTLLALILIFVLLSILSPRFLTADNLSNVLASSTSPSERLPDWPACWPPDYWST